MKDLPAFNKYYSIAYGDDVGLQFPKIAIFNGHATTMWPLINALGFMYYPEVPPASGVYLEYWRTGTAHSVKMFYEVLNADGSYDQYPMWFPGQTSDKLPLADFVAHLEYLYQDVPYTDKAEECQTPYESTGVYFSGYETLVEIFSYYDLPPPPQPELK
mmetsp:Transcript_3467/g.3422  ORF Transcript_3467/g.3422 Transcript_3467/m.3422 type:complete len:159 (+) Transcript_3467:554-1030(+)